MSAYGNGTTYAAAWSDPSDVVPVTTRECLYPEYRHDLLHAQRQPMTRMWERAWGPCLRRTQAAVRCEYEIREGNEDGLFAIGESNGEVTVAADLSGKGGDNGISESCSLERNGRWAECPREGGEYHALLDRHGVEACRNGRRPSRAGWPWPTAAAASPWRAGRALTGQARVRRRTQARRRELGRGCLGTAGAMRYS